MKKIAYAILALMLSFSNVFAQRVLEPDDYLWAKIYNDVRMEQFFGTDYDFACLYQPGIAKPDYGYAYFSKKHRLVLVECQTHFPFPENKRNPDGSIARDADGNFIILPIEKVKIKKQSFRIPDSLGTLLNELFQLAVLTAHRDTCPSEEPPIYDIWGWSFFTHHNPIGATDNPAYVPCDEDTSHNVQRFHNIHRAIEKSVRTKDVQPVINKMPDIQALIEDWRNLLEQKN